METDKGRESRQKSRQRGRLFVVSGPSGAGKGTLLRRVLSKTPTLKKCITVTTRPLRQGEVNGREYFFVSVEEFERLKQQNAFLEWANVYGNLYGSPKQSVDEQLSAGYDVVLEIDVQGALQVKNLRPDATLIFILPPSLEELERRLRCRKLDSPEVVQRRLQKAKAEMSLLDEFHHHIVNDDADRAAEELQNLMERQKTNKLKKGSEMVIMHNEG